MPDREELEPRHRDAMKAALGSMALVDYVEKILSIPLTKAQAILLESWCKMQQETVAALEKRSYVIGFRSGMEEERAKSRREPPSEN